MRTNPLIFAAPGWFPLALAAGAANGDWCATLADIGKIHSAPENPILQSLTLEGRLHYQASHIDGSDDLGKRFQNSADNYRRARLGAKAEFLRYFSAKAVLDMALDNRYRGGELDWGYQFFDSATLTFDIRKAFSVTALDKLAFTYGRDNLLMTSEVKESSNNILTIERSAIANKLFGGSRTSGFSLLAGKGDWLLTTAVYSSEDDADFIGGFNDGLAYYAAIDLTVPENLTYRLDAIVNDTSAGDDDLIGYDWATSFNVIYDESPCGILATVVLGDNGAIAGGQGGAFHGLTLMPWYWIIEGKLQAVFQYSYSGSDEAAGIRANLRYVSGSQNIASVNSGRGDELHTFYLGLNHYLCGNNLKLMGGIEYSALETPGGGVDALTYSLAVRMKF
jgi:hypothetical protein